MARSARLLSGTLPALLLVLEATSSIAVIELRNAGRRGVIAAPATPAASHAVPLAGLVPDEPRGADPLTFPHVPLAARTASVIRSAEGHRVVLASPERTWLQVHRRRAPSPDDPDPL